MNKPNEKQQQQIIVYLQEVKTANDKLNAYLLAVSDGLMLEGNNTFDPDAMEFISKKETKKENIQHGTSNK